MVYYQIILEAYGWQGIAFMAMLLLLFSIQIFHYAARLRPIGKYLIKKRRVIHKSAPPISVVVPMFSEDYQYIESTLLELVAQEGAQFEIVIVYVGCDNDFYDDLVRLKSHYPNIVATKIERNERFPISVKTALNVGIKAANYEHILFTTTDARPASNKWISLMARGFQRGDVVLGYCGVESESNGFGAYFVRITRLFHSMQWLAKAVGGKPYRAIRSNMGFTRSLYFKVNGFNRLNMNIGEDDLFIQTILKDDNASVILAPRATVLQKCWGGMHGLVDTSRFYDSAVKFYPRWARNFIDWEMSSRSLFFLLTIVGLIFLPLELKVAIGLLAIIRLIVVISSVKQVATRLGEPKVAARYLFYDLLSPLFALFMRIKMLKRDKRVWR